MATNNNNEEKQKAFDEVWGVSKNEEEETTDNQEAFDEVWGTDSSPPPTEGAPTSNQSQQQQQQDYGYEPDLAWSNFFSDAWKSLESGTYRAGSSGIESINMLFTQDNIIQPDVNDGDEQLQEGYEASQETAKELQDMGYGGYAGYITNYAPDSPEDDRETIIERTAEDLKKAAIEASPGINTDIIQTFGNGDISGGIYKTAMGLFSTAPQLIAMLGAHAVGAPTVGLGMVGASATGGKYQEIKNRNDLTEDQKRAIAVAHGLIEVTAEKLGTNKLLKKTFSKLPKDAVYKGFLQVIAKFTGTEAFEEMATSLAQDATDKVTGIAPELTGWQIGANVLNSGIIGAGMGTALGGLRIALRNKSKTPTDTDINQQQQQDVDVVDEDAQIKQQQREEITLEDTQAEPEAQQRPDITGDITNKIVETYEYSESRTADIQDTMDTIYKLGPTFNVSPDIVSALMKIESDFTNIEANADSSAIGPLQITEAALEDLDRVGMQVLRPMDTKAGRIEAGMKYFKMLRDHYGFEGDELIASYYAGPTYVRNKGISDAIVEDQISTREYVSRFKEAHSKLIGMEYDNTTTTNEETEVVTEATSVEDTPVGLDSVEKIQEALNTIGYPVTSSNGELDVDTLSVLSQYQNDRGLDWDTSNLGDNTVLDNNFKESIKQDLEAAGETDLLSQIESQESAKEAVDTINEDTNEVQAVEEEQQPQQPQLAAQEYWEKYKNFGSDLKAELEPGDQTGKTIDWVLERDMETPYQEAFQLENINKPSEGGPINTTRILQDPKKLNLINQVADIVNSDDSVQTFEDIETEANAELEGETPEEIVKNLGMVKENAEHLRKVLKTAPKVVNQLREVVSSSATALTDLAKEIKQTEGANSKLKLYQFLAQMQEHKTLTGDLRTIQKQTARTLSSQRMYVDGKNVNLRDLDVGDLEGKTAKEIGKLIDVAGGEDAIVDIADKIISGEDTGDIGDTVRDYERNKPWLRAFVEWRLTNIFMNVSTLWRNVQSQALNVIGDTTTNYAAATTSLFKRGSDTAPADLEQANEQINMTFNGANKRTMGNVMGVINSVKNPIVSMKDLEAISEGKENVTNLDIMLMALKDPVKFEKLTEQVQLESRIRHEGMAKHYMTTENLWPTLNNNSTIGKLVSGTINNILAVKRLLGFAGLQAGDKPFEYAAYFEEIAGQTQLLKQTEKLQQMSKTEQKDYLNKVRKATIAYRALKMADPTLQEQATKIANADESTDVEQVYKELQEEFVGEDLEVSENIMKDAITIDKFAKQHSAEMTWKDDFEEGTSARWFEKLTYRNPWYKVLVPVFHTPMKIFQRGINYTPAGKQFRQDMSGTNGQRAKTQAQGRIAVAAMLLTYGAHLMASNRLTPTARDEEERRRMQLAKVQPNSVKTNGKWYDYNQMDPFPAFFFNAVSSGYRAIKETIDDPTINDEERVQQVIANTLIGIGKSLLNKTMFTTLQQVVNGISYGGAGWWKNFEASLSPTYTARRNWEDRELFGLNPFYQEYRMTEEDLVKRDMLGKPIMNYKHFGGITVTEETESQIRQELFDLKITLPALDDRVENVKLTPKQYNTMMRYMDEEVKAEERLNTFVNSNAYKSLNNYQKERELRNLWQDLKDETRTVLFENKEYLEEFQKAKNKSYLRKTEDREYPSNFFREGTMNIDAGEFWDLLMNSRKESD